MHYFLYVNIRERDWHKTLLFASKILSRHLEFRSISRQPLSLSLSLSPNSRHGLANSYQDLIRFPYENVIHDFRPSLNCSSTRIHADYEAFEIDDRGHLAFTRSFGKEKSGAGAPPRKVYEIGLERD
jgi:hypothetical protein